MPKAKLKEVLVMEPDDKAGAAAAATKPPLFADRSGDTDTIEKIEVRRLEPVFEGKLDGYLPVEADEEMVHRRWGGGMYELIGRGADGQIKARRTVTLSGEPKLSSLEARRKYKIVLGQEPEDNTKTERAPSAPPIGLADVVAMLTTAHQQQVEMMRLQIEANARAADEREAKARREADEREAKARREAQEHDARIRRENDESRERDRQFQATMLTMVKGDAKANDPSTAVTMLMKGIELAQSLNSGSGGAEPSDPVTALFQNLPAVRDMMAAAGAGQGAAPGAAPAPPGAPGSGPQIKLSGPVAAKMIAAAQQLKKSGHDPNVALEQVLTNVFDQIASAPAAAPTPAAPAAPVADELAQARAVGRKKTTAPSRATAKK